MVRRTKLFLALAGMFAFVTLGLSACNFEFMPTTVQDALKADRNANSPKVSVPTIHEQGVLKVGLRNSTMRPPLIIQDSKGDLSGIDIDVVSAVADDLGLSVQFIPIPDQGAESQVDVVVDVKTTDAPVTVVGKILESAVGFFWKGNSGVIEKDQLMNKTVAVQSASTSLAVLEKTDLVMTVKGFANLNEAFDALNSGSVDFVLCDTNAGAYIANQYAGIVMCGTIDNPAVHGIGVPSSNIALQQAISASLDKLNNNGVLKLITVRWMGDLVEVNGESQIKNIGTKKKPESTESNSSSNKDDATNNSNTSSVSSTTDASGSTNSGSESDTSTAGANAGSVG